MNRNSQHHFPLQTKNRAKRCKQQGIVALLLVFVPVILLALIYGFIFTYQHSKDKSKTQQQQQHETQHTSHSRKSPQQVKEAEDFADF